MLLEGADARVHWLYHSEEMAAARSRGELRANSFIRLRKLFINGRPLLEVEDLGHSERILGDRGHLEETARRLTRRDVKPVDAGWDGWLGRYQKALLQVASDLEQHQGPLEHARRPRRIRSQSLGR
jgi:hypothetical protein